MAIAPPSTTAKELRFERSAPPSRVFTQSVSSIYTDFFSGTLCFLPLRRALLAPAMLHHPQCFRPDGL